LYVSYNYTVIDTHALREDLM